MKTGRYMKRLAPDMIFSSHGIMMRICILMVLLTGSVPVIAFSEQIASPAPAFELTDTNGRTISLEKLRGKVVLLNFWAPWCVSCREELPELETLYMRYNETGFEVIGICVDAPGSTLTRFLQKFSLTFPILTDPTGKTADAYRLTELPTSFIIGRDGVVRYLHKGYRKESLPVYRKEIDELLKKQ